MSAPTAPLVTRSRDLAGLCERLARAEFVVVDTEFVRDRTYYPRLCLVQVATPSEHALIDPLALEDLDPLRDVLLEPSILKVFHAARQDLEVFLHLWGKVPSPIYDTQLAASVAGLGDQVSYATLAHALVGVTIQKGTALTDWTRRPLTPDQLAYAAADVVHLVPAFAALKERLDSLGRGRWLEREMERLTDPRLHAPDADGAWESVKGAAGLRGAARAVVRELAAWREGEAQRRDVPRRWVVPDEALVALARKPPRDAGGLRDVRMIPEGLARTSADAILAAVQRGLAAPAPPVEPRAPQGPTEEQRAVADLMACLVRLRAKEQGVSVGSLATRADIERVAVEGSQADVAVLSGWRRTVVGDDLVALREGRLQLVVRDGAVVVERPS